MGLAAPLEELIQFGVAHPHRQEQRGEAETQREDFHLPGSATSAEWIQAQGLTRSTASPPPVARITQDFDRVVAVG
jgi:hypothetical protein